MNGVRGLIDQRQWHLRYDILKSKKCDVKKLTSKISEEFTIVITLFLQMLGLKQSCYAPGGLNKKRGVKWRWGRAGGGIRQIT